MVRISDAEFEVMKIIWKRKQATSLEIIGDLKNCKWTQNTIRTLIKRLEAKGAIKVIDKKGKAYTYAPIIDEKEYKNEMTKDLLKRLYNNSLKEFILQYHEGVKVKPEEFEELLRYIEGREKNKEQKGW